MSNNKKSIMPVKIVDSFNNSFNSLTEWQSFVFGKSAESIKIDISFIRELLKK